jgi:hypothetical protein
MNDLEARLVKVELEVSRLVEDQRGAHKLRAEMNKKLDKVLDYQQNQKSFIAGILFVITTVSWLFTQFFNGKIHLP